MGVEIERKFLVLTNDWRGAAGPATRLRQGYLSQAGGVTARVRCAGDDAFLTVKGPRDGLARPEFEYPIPVRDAERMLSRLAQSAPLLKVRYPVTVRGLTWEVDVFEGPHQGLVLAEIELEHPSQEIDIPAWIGEEVTADRRYRGSALARSGFVPQRDRDRSDAAVLIEAASPA